jgi:hypothetical protein
MSIVETIGKPLLDFGFNMVLSHQEKQNAKGVANAAAQQQQRQMELNKQEADLLQQKMDLLKTPPAAAAAGGGNTGLYIGLGVGGLVITGLVVFFIVRKKQ